MTYKRARMIVEGIVTTANEDGSPNIAPMGPIVSEQLDRLILRPYRGSRTLANLQRTGHGIFHITDDVELLARAAVDQLEDLPSLTAYDKYHAFILDNACRWYAFSVVQLDVSRERSEIACDIVDQGRLRDFLGFNRAKHAVLEAAILATRLHLLPRDQINTDLERLKTIVDKTAGPQEHRAFEFITQYIITH